MWCPVCSADVATELSTDDRRLHCARCGVELRLSEAALHRWQGSAERPEDLLARWTAEEILAMESRHSVAEEQLSRETNFNSGTNPAPSQNPLPTQPSPNPTSRSRSQAPKRRALKQPSSPSSAQGWVAAAGQLAAYGGVLLLTGGTAMVISAHYSGNVSNAATGWLTASVGQMLLFLGVITVVSQGIEQTRRELQLKLSKLERRLKRLTPREQHHTPNDPSAPAHCHRSAA